MTDLMTLYDLAEADNISVYSFDMPLSQSASVMYSDGSCAIAIDPFRLASSADETVKLAHELGHCETGAFYNIYSDFDVRGRAEHKANIWAIKKLVPKNELIQAFDDGVTETWNLAEHFNVTEDFIVQCRFVNDVLQN